LALGNVDDKITERASRKYGIFGAPMTPITLAQLKYRSGPPLP
jgi:hypothetical protein